MNLRLVFLLSLFGLAMAIATVFVLPSRLETFCWPVIFVVCAAVVARRAPGFFFLHGFLVGFTNWVWVALAHVLLWDAYRATHLEEIAAWRSLSAPGPLAAFLGVLRTHDLPIPGASGVVIGLLAWIASRFLRRRPDPIER